MALESARYPEIFNQFPTVGVDNNDIVLVYKQSTGQLHGILGSNLLPGTDTDTTTFIWSAATTYATDEVVVFNDLWYRSLQDSNLNNIPATGSAFWTQINRISTVTIPDWTAGLYVERAAVFVGNVLYRIRSTVTLPFNSTTSPDSDPTNWESVPTKASNADADGGTNNTNFMTALLVVRLLANNYKIERSGDDWNFNDASDAPAIIMRSDGSMEFPGSSIATIALEAISGQNFISLSQNLADAMSIISGVLKYFQFDTRVGNEKIRAFQDFQVEQSVTYSEQDAEPGPPQTGFLRVYAFGGDIKAVNSAGQRFTLTSTTSGNFIATGGTTVISPITLDLLNNNGSLLLDKNNSNTIDATPINLLHIVTNNGILVNTKFHDVQFNERFFSDVVKASDNHFAKIEIATDSTPNPDEAYALIGWGTTSNMTSASDTVLRIDSQGARFLSDQSTKIATSPRHLVDRGYIDENSGLKRTVVVTSAQILALNTTPVEIVPAPGTGKYIVLHHAIVSMDFNSAVYTTGVVLQFLSGGVPVTEQESILDQNSNHATQLRPIRTLTINGNIELTALPSDPIGGNSNIKATVYYTIEDIAEPLP